MLTEEDDVEICALAARGWSVSAISRHSGRDRKTVRKYLGPRAAGAVAAPSCLEPFRAYIVARFEDDHHLEATVLYRELLDAGLGRSYPTLVRELRRLELRPVCPVCAHRRGGQVTTEIDHPAGEEIQWDWLELAAADVPWGEPAYVLVGALSHSGRFRGVFCEQMTFGHLAAAMHEILVALGGTPRVWRTDRMATVVTPQTGRITPDAAALAKHYGTAVAVCPPRRAQRKGVVEAAIKYLTRSWWRTATVASMRRGAARPGRLERPRRRQAQAPRRDRRRGRRRRAAAGAAAVAPTRPRSSCSARSRGRRWSAFEGNRYSVPPAQAGRTVTVTWRIAEPIVRIVSAHGEIVAEHRRAPAGAAQTVRSAEHAALLEAAVLAAFTTDNACRRKPNLPPGDRALEELVRLRGIDPEPAQVISLADYAKLAQAREQAR